MKYWRTFFSQIRLVIRGNDTVEKDRYGTWYVDKAYIVAEIDSRATFL